MANSLFPEMELENYLLDISYRGDSFDGFMEIDALGREILGLQVCLQRAVEILKKHKKIDFSLNDIDIYIEAFEHGSFRKKVTLVKKEGNIIERNPATSTIIATVFVGILAVAATIYTSGKKELTPEDIERLHDQVKIELLQDKKFLEGLGEIVRPLRTESDTLSVKDSAQKETIVDYEQKRKIAALSGSEEVDSPETNGYQVLRGHVTRVDLDADINHIGFKIEDKGALVLCSLPPNITRDQMKDFLDQWVQIEGVTTFRGAEIKHVSVDSIKIINKPSQSKIDFNGETSN